MGKRYRIGIDWLNSHLLSQRYGGNNPTFANSFWEGEGVIEFEHDISAIHTRRQSASCRGAFSTSFLTVSEVRVSNQTAKHSLYMSLYHWKLMSFSFKTSLAVFPLKQTKYNTKTLYQSDFNKTSIHRWQKMKLQNAEDLIELWDDLPIALYRGLPLSLSQTTVVSLWFVIPTAGNNNTNIDTQHFNRKNNLENFCRLFFFQNFWGHLSFLWGQWYPYFGFPMRSTLGFKARVDPLLVYFVTCVQ